MNSQIIIMTGVGLIAGIVFSYMFRVLVRKKKVDLYLLKKLVYDNGIKSKEVYEAFKELETIFKEMENAN